MNGHEIYEEAPDVAEDNAPPADGRDDRSEGIVTQDHVRCLLRYLRSASPHGDPDVRFLEGRRIVDAVTQHGHDLASLLVQRQQIHFVLRRGARKNTTRAQLFLFRRVQLVDVFRNMTDPGMGLVHDADRPPDAQGGFFLITRGHDHVDASRLAGVDSRLYRRTRRIVQAAQTQEDKFGVRFVIQRFRLTPGQRQDAQSVRCKVAVLVAPCLFFLFRERYSRLGAGFPVAGVKNGVRGPFDGDPVRSIRRLMKCCHHLPIRIKGNFPFFRIGFQ